MISENFYTINSILDVHEYARIDIVSLARLARVLKNLIEVSIVTFLSILSIFASSSHSFIITFAQHKTEVKIAYFDVLTFQRTSSSSLSSSTMSALSRWVLVMRMLFSWKRTSNCKSKSYFSNSFLCSSRSQEHHRRQFRVKTSVEYVNLKHRNRAWINWFSDNVSFSFINDDLKKTRIKILANRVAASAHADVVTSADVFVSVDNIDMKLEKTSFRLSISSQRLLVISLKLSLSWSSSRRTLVWESLRLSCSTCWTSLFLSTVT